MSKHLINLRPISLIAKIVDLWRVKMLTEHDRDVILRCAEKYNVSSVFLFGSSIRKGKADDVDLGVNGLLPRLFFKFYAELIKHLSKPVDLVDLSRKSLFNKLVEEEGIKIYG